MLGSAKTLPAVLRAPLTWDREAGKCGTGNKSPTLTSTSSSAIRTRPGSGPPENAVSVVVARLGRPAGKPHTFATTLARRAPLFAASPQKGQLVTDGVSPIWTPSMDVSAYRPIVAGLARGVAAKSECQSYRQTSGDDDSQCQSATAYRTVMAATGNVSGASPCS